MPPRAYIYLDKKLSKFLNKQIICIGIEASDKLNWLVLGVNWFKGNMVTFNLQMKEVWISKANCTYDWSIKEDTKD